MNILAVIIFGVLLLSIFNGYRNGFLKTMFSLVSWILVLVICNVATPMVTNMLMESTDIEVTIQMALDAKIDEMLTNAMNEAGIPELPDVLPEGVDFKIPEELQAALPEELKNMLSNSNRNIWEADFIDTSKIAESAVVVISLLLVMVFARLAITIVYVVLGIASKLPLIGPLDKLLGFACGAGKGVIWSWVILTIVSVLALTGTNTEWAGYIADSQILTWLQENNVILNLLIQ